MNGRNILLGDSNFSRMVKDECYLVDKTDGIRRLFEDGHAVSLVTRPRRFGKTFTLRMLEAFFALDSCRSLETLKAAELFRGTAVLRDSAFCKRHMAKWPVVFLSFKDVYAATMDDALGSMAWILSEAAAPCENLLDSPKVSEALKAKLEDLLQADDFSLEELREMIVNGLPLLAEVLRLYYGHPCLLLIDEYDAPVIRAAAHGFGEAMQSFLRAFFERALQESPNVGKAVLTGCVPLTQSVLKEIRDLGCHTMDDQATLGELVGLTRPEVQRVLKDFGLASCIAEVEAHYGGRRAGDEMIISPWDLLNFCDDAVRAGQPAYGDYWIQTSANAAVQDFVESMRRVSPERLDRLLAGDVMEADLSPELFCASPWNNETLASQLRLLLTAGYVSSAGRSESGRWKLRLPNEEVRECFLRFAASKDVVFW